MNLQDMPAWQPDIDTLKKDLTAFCSQYEIKKFEAEDIIELLEDGEDVAWLVDQLKGENTAIDTEKITTLLSEIQSVVGPEEEEEEEEPDLSKQIDVETANEPAGDPGIPDLSQLDLSQLQDMELPGGMKLPKDFDMDQLQKIMESPQGEFMADFSVFCQEKGVDLTSDFISDPQQQQALNEEWMNAPRDAFGGKTPSEMLNDNPSLMPQKVETYRREQPRVGRNDPCPCGSGKKYKKCCGRGH